MIYLYHSNTYCTEADLTFACYTHLYAVDVFAEWNFTEEAKEDGHDLQEARGHGQRVVGIVVD